MFRTYSWGPLVHREQESHRGLSQGTRPQPTGTYSLECRCRVCVGFITGLWFLLPSFQDLLLKMHLESSAVSLWVSRPEPPRPRFCGRYTALGHSFPPWSGSAHTLTPTSGGSTALLRPPSQESLSQAIVFLVNAMVFHITEQPWRVLSKYLNHFICSQGYFLKMNILEPTHLTAQLGSSSREAEML